MFSRLIDEFALSVDRAAPLDYRTFITKQAGRRTGSRAAKL